MRDSRLKRRLITVPAVIVGFAALLPALIVLVPVAALVDLVLRRRFATVRLLAFATCYLAWELVSVAAAFALWVMSGFGLLLERRWMQRAHRRLQARWVDSLLHMAESLLGLHIEVDGAEVLHDGPLVVLCRHASMVDTLIPAHLLTHRGFNLRYVLKRELLWDPALDIIGYRIPNHFLDRGTADTPSELAALERLSTEAGSDEAVVIFPEGSRWTPQKREAAQRRIEASDPDLAARLADQRHTLPPRPNGTLAVLAGSPHADVVTLAHTGLEGLTGPLEALRLLPFRHPIQVSLWRTDRAELPTEHAAQAAWLTDEWARVDEWVSRRIAH